VENPKTLRLIENDERPTHARRRSRSARTWDHGRPAACPARTRSARCSISAAHAASTSSSGSPSRLARNIAATSARSAAESDRASLAICSAAFCIRTSYQVPRWPSTAGSVTSSRVVAGEVSVEARIEGDVHGRLGDRAAAIIFEDLQCGQIGGGHRGTPINSGSAFRGIRPSSKASSRNWQTERRPSSPKSRVRWLTYMATKRSVSASSRSRP